MELHVYRCLYCKQSYLLSIVEVTRAFPSCNDVLYVEPIRHQWAGAFSVTAQPYITTMKMYCLDMERPIIYFNILILEMVLSCNLYFTLIVQTIKCFLLLFNGTKY